MTEKRGRSERKNERSEKEKEKENGQRTFSNAVNSYRSSSSKLAMYLGLKPAWSLSSLNNHFNATFLLADNPLSPSFGRMTTLGSFAICLSIAKLCGSVVWSSTMTHWTFCSDWPSTVAAVSSIILRGFCVAVMMLTTGATVLILPFETTSGERRNWFDGGRCCEMGWL